MCTEPSYWHRREKKAGGAVRHRPSKASIETPSDLGLLVHRSVVLQLQQVGPEAEPSSAALAADPDLHGVLLVEVPPVGAGRLLDDPLLDAHALPIELHK